MSIAIEVSILLISSANYDFGKILAMCELCIGARRIRVRADHTHTPNCNDRILVRYGTTTGSFHKLTLCGEHNARTWDYITEFVVLQWETNDDDHRGLGIHGYVQYLD